MKTCKTKRTNLIGTFCLLFILIAGIFSIIATDNNGNGGGGGIEVRESYMLAFQKLGSSQIQVQWSYDGQNWESGGFPREVTSEINPTTIKGIGAAVDNSSVLSIVAFNQPNSIEFAWGLGPSVWDNYSTTTPSAPPASGPSIAYLERNKWIVPFRRTDETVTIGIFNNSERICESEIPIYGSLNTNVEGRPSVIKKGEKIVIVWRRWNGEVFSLIYTVGTISNGTPSFSGINEIELPMSDEFLSGLVNDPCVTVAKNDFVLSFIREQRGGAGLHGWRANLMKSSDGISWQPHATPIVSAVAVHNQTILNIAGFKDGSLVLAGIKKRASGAGTQLTAARYHQTEPNVWRWTEIDANTMFGSSAAYKQFALISR